MNSYERAARYSDLFAEHDQHPSTCSYCPICATIAVVRNTRPEVLEHLAGAAREIIAAVRLLLDEAEGVLGGLEDHARTEPATEHDNVRRIDAG